jgi:hypothetical protein
MAGPVDPPHGVAAGVDQLELQVVAGRVAAKLEGEPVVAGQHQRQVALDPGVARHAVEVVVQAQRLAVHPVCHPQPADHLVGGDHAPRRRIVEAVEQPRRLGRGSIGGGAFPPGQRRRGEQARGKRAGGQDADRAREAEATREAGVGHRRMRVVLLSWPGPERGLS